MKGQNRIFIGWRAAVSSIALIVTSAVLIGILSSIAYATEITWVERTPMSTARSKPAVVAVGGKVYVFGGETLGSPGLATVETYDPIADTWTPKTPMPTSRRGAAAAVVNGKVYIIGGVAPGDVFLSSVEEYDPIGMAPQAVQHLQDSHLDRYFTSRD